MPTFQYRSLSRSLVSLLALFPAMVVAQENDSDLQALRIQGEYAGTVTSPEGELKVGVQVIALGENEFRAVATIGGLPGDGWEDGQREAVEGTLREGEVIFEGKNATGTLRDGAIELVDREGSSIGTLKRVERKSESLGAKPPQGAVVLFSGESADAFVAPRGGKAKLENGLLVAGANSKQRFGDHRLHLEFRTPFQPKARGQKRGNSGCYLQGRYEVQILDSYGLEGKNNECGGIYGIKDPDINMCFPPMAWQTYDIDFTAARFDENGEKVANARITVRHNGVVIHDDVELPRTTTAAPLKENAEDGFLHLQDHGNPVRYRNIWIVEKKKEKSENR